MPGYEPFLLCDFHVHTQWSDGKLSVAEVVDLYGSTGKFDVIAITDHILMKKDMLARAGRLATLGRRAFGVREEDFAAYLEDVAAQAARAWTTYGMLVVPGADITQNRLSGRKNSHIIALDIKRYVGTDQPADAILKEIRRRRCSRRPLKRVARTDEIVAIHQGGQDRAAQGRIERPEPRRLGLGQSQSRHLLKFCLRPP